MHKVSKKDLTSAELETTRTSRSPTTVMTANGEVQTKEEATVYVKQLDKFVKVMFLEETPANLSLEKLCEDHGYTYSTEPAVKNHISYEMARELIEKIQLCTICGSWFMREFFLNYTFSYFFIIFITGFRI